MGVLEGLWREVVFASYKGWSCIFCVWDGFCLAWVAFTPLLSNYGWETEGREVKDYLLLGVGVFFIPVVVPDTPVLVVHTYRQLGQFLWTRRHVLCRLPRLLQLLQRIRRSAGRLGAGHEKTCRV